MKFGGSTWNLVWIGLVVIEEKKFKNTESEGFGPRSMNDLDLWYSYTSCSYLVDCIYQLSYHRLQYFWKIHCFTFFPYKSTRDKIWPCRKIGQGQPRVITWTNLEYSSTRCCISTCKVISLLVQEKKKCSSCYCIWAWWPSWSCDLDHLNELSFHYPMEDPHQIWLQSAQQFLRKEVWKCWFWATLVQGQWMTLTFDIHIRSCTHLVNCVYQLWRHRL